MRSITNVLLAVSLAYLCHPALSQPIFGGSVISVDVIDHGPMLNAEHIVLKGERLYGSIRAGYGQFLTGLSKLKVYRLALSSFISPTRHHVHGALVSLMGHKPDSRTALRGGKLHKALYLAPLAGYRFQQAHGGIFFKIEFVFNMEVHQYGGAETDSLQWLYHTAIGMGYFFANKKSKQ